MLYPTELPGHYGDCNISVAEILRHAENILTLDLTRSGSLLLREWLLPGYVVALSLIHI